MILRQFEQYIQEKDLVKPGESILLGISGGRDSMVLLDLFYRLKSSYNLRLYAAHINHLLRGKTSNSDECFVLQMTQKYGIPVFSVSVDVKTYVKTMHLSIEEAAREIRFRYYAKWLTSTCSHKIALGHHRQDQAETVLMHLIRGSGLRGLGGIQPKRNCIIHPLLIFSRDEINTYVQQRSIPFIDDVSNDSLKYFRNQVRHNLLPAISNIYGKSSIETIATGAEALQEIESFIDYETQKRIKQVIHNNWPDEIILDIVTFLRYFKAIQKSILFWILKQINCPTRYHIINRFMWLAEGKTKGKISLNKDTLAYRYGDQIYIVPKDKHIIDIPVQSNQTCCLETFNFDFLIYPANMSKVDFKSDPQVEFIDADCLRGQLRLRNYKQGDWFIPLGMKGKKKLHDFFIDQKIPPHKRSQTLLLTEGNNIVWLIGLRLDERYKVKSQTKDILRLTIKPIRERGKNG